LTRSAAASRSTFSLPWRRKKTVAQAGADPFDDEFQRKLESLALVSRRVFAGRLRAERRTKKSGSGVEFADYRDYQHGDDFRSLDWNVYQRFERLLVRLYAEEEDLAIYFVLDSSASMAFGDGRKALYAKQVVAALSYVGLANLDRTSIVTASDRVSGRLPETRGRARIFRTFRFLRALEFSGRTDLAEAMKGFVAQNKRRGLAVIVSDLYDPHGFERGVNLLRYHKFDTFVVHVVDPSDAAPALRGDVLVRDCETGDEREVTVTSSVLSQLSSAYERYKADVEHFCATHQVAYVAASVDVPFEELVLRVFRKGGFLR
jgi:uncharacterized protein (DUF58 family)